MKDYLGRVRTRRRAFVPLAHPPGHAQIDFGAAVGVIGAKRSTLHLFCMYLPHSDAIFVKAYPGGDDGGAAGRRGMVPQSGLLDNMKLAVVRILPDRNAGARGGAHAAGRPQFIRGPLRPRQRQRQCRGACELCAPRDPNLSPQRAIVRRAQRNVGASLSCAAGNCSTHRPPIGERLMADLAAFRSTAERGLRSPRHATWPGQLDGLGALSKRRLLGPNGARLHDGSGEGVRR